MEKCSERQRDWKDKALRKAEMVAVLQQKTECIDKCPTEPPQLWRYATSEWRYFSTTVIDEQIQDI
jgi:hypothetical protein